MKMSLPILAALGLLATTLELEGRAMRAEGVYGALTAGTGLPSDIEISEDAASATLEGEDGIFQSFWVAGTVGYRLASPFRIEAFAGYTGRDLDTLENGTGTQAIAGDSALLLFGAQALYDFGLAQGITPYLGGGVGGVYLDNEFDTALVPDTEIDGTGFAFIASAGVAFDLFANADLLVGYRYYITPEFDVTDQLGTDSKAEISGHLFEAGLRFTPWQ